MQAFCDFCKQAGKSVDARVDGPTVYGPWAYMCESHERIYAQPGFPVTVLANIKG